MQKVTVMKTAKQAGMLRQKWNSKKQLNNSRLAIFKSILASTLIMISLSCSNDDTITVVPDPNQEEPKQEDPQPEDPQPENPVVPTLTSINPTSGPKTTLVTILGEHFGTDTAKVKVFFNEQEATVQAVADSIIHAEVPVRAGTGAVKVQVDSLELIGPEFDYELTVLVSTFAGSTEGDTDGTATSALFNDPTDGVFDSQGNLFFVDSRNHKIRMITPEKEVITIAGSIEGKKDGFGIDAQFRLPHSITIDSNDNLYVSEPNNQKIRKIAPNGLVSTHAGGTLGHQDGVGTEASFVWPAGLAMDADDNLYVADRYGHTIRKITPQGVVSTFAGSTLGDEDGNRTSAKFKEPTSVCFDTQGNLLVADSGNHKIRKITPDGTVSTYAGSTNGFQNGSPVEAKFSIPYHIKPDPDGNLYIIEHGNNDIRKISADGLVVSSFTIRGIGNEDGHILDATFNKPFGLITGEEHRIYVFDTGNNRVREITQE